MTISAVGLEDKKEKRPVPSNTQKRDRTAGPNNRAGQFGGVVRGRTGDVGGVGLAVRAS